MSASLIKRFAFLAIAGGILLVVVFWGGGKPTGAPLSVRFSHYEKSADGSNVAVVMLLTNSSERTFEYFLAGGNSASGTVLVNCEYRYQTPAGFTNWIMPLGRTYTSYFFSAHSSAYVAAPLISTAGPQKIAVICIEPPRRLTGWQDKLRRFWWRFKPPRVGSYKVLCETELSDASARQAIDGGPERIMDAY